MMLMGMDNSHSFLLSVQLRRRPDTRVPANLLSNVVNPSGTSSAVGQPSAKKPLVTQTTAATSGGPTLKMAWGQRAAVPMVSGSASSSTPKPSAGGSQWSLPPSVPAVPQRVPTPQSQLWTPAAPSAVAQHSSDPVPDSWDEGDD